MEKLLATYLYEYKNCPLPGIGSLVLNPGQAKLLPGEKRMLAPMPFIELTEKEAGADTLVSFIASETNSRVTEAENYLNRFCERLTALQANEELPLASAGSFYKDSNEVLHFKTIPLPAAYFPEAAAERVIHPDVSHNILVGDTQTNSAAMTEMLSAGGTTTRTRWWIAAVVLGLIGVIGLVIYFTHHTHGGMFGNIKPVEAAQSPKTYAVPNK
jgi:hypothetical protein